MNKTTWIIIGALCVIGLGGLVVFTKKDSVNVDNIDPNSIIQTTDKVRGDNTFGNKDAKVKLFEYADMQCGGCAAAHANLVKIADIYKGQVLFVFRNFPLTNGHPNALAAATVAEAAGLQGKFWEMNRRLYEDQSAWSSLSADQRGDAFNRYAQELDLDMNKFKTDLSSRLIAEKIKVDRALASKLGVNSTPTLYVNDKKMSADVIEDVMQQKGNKLMDQLDKVLKADGQTPPARQP